MGRKILVLLLAVVGAALVVLPATASAQSWHIDKVTKFSVEGVGGTLTGGASSVTCTATGGFGSFSTTTEGTVDLLFLGCKESILGMPCTTPGSSNGAIHTTAKFDAIMVVSSQSEKIPGILLTPDTSIKPTASSGSSELASLFQFTEANCLVYSFKVFGKGVIGTISTPSCSAPSGSKMSVSFSATGGTQNHLTWTGGAYDLRSTISPASHPTSGLDATAVMEFPEVRSITCT